MSQAGGGASGAHSASMDVAGGLADELDSAICGVLGLRGWSDMSSRTAAAGACRLLARHPPPISSTAQQPVLPTDGMRQSVFFYNGGGRPPRGGWDRSRPRDLSERTMCSDLAQGCRLPSQATPLSAPAWWKPDLTRITASGGPTSNSRRTPPPPCTAGSPRPLRLLHLGVQGALLGLPTRRVLE